MDYLESQTSQNDINSLSQASRDDWTRPVVVFFVEMRHLSVDPSVVLQSENL